MPRKPYPWPIREMTARYVDDGQTCREIAAWLSQDGWQHYWKQHIGREYRPSSKIVNKVLCRAGCPMRPSGAPVERNGNWKGGRRIDKGGYILVRKPNHPHATKAGYVREHRIAVEQAIGRFLLPTEVVHHIDDDPSNNKFSNLIVFENQAVHISQTMKGKVPPERIAKARAARWKDHVPKTILQSTPVTDAQG